MACVDAVNRQSMLPGSVLQERELTYGDHFKNVHPTTDWVHTLDHAEKIGIGTKDYELIQI